MATLNTQDGEETRGEREVRSSLCKRDENKEEVQLPEEASLRIKHRNESAGFKDKINEAKK